MFYINPHAEVKAKYGPGGPLPAPTVFDQPALTVTVKEEICYKI